MVCNLQPATATLQFRDRTWVRTFERTEPTEIQYSNISSIFQFRLSISVYTF